MVLFKKALFPLKIAYSSVIRLRQLAYKYSIIKSHKFSFPIIVVGNLSTGGTGKTPMIDYLLQKFTNKTTLAVLSRGYGRKSSGFFKLSKFSNASNVGDEPLMLLKKHPNTIITVGENRFKAIKKIVENYPKVKSIILDDGMQHLKLIPSFKILLTTFDKPWFKDELLPVGNLRANKSQSKHADVVVVTKCPHNIDLKTKILYKKKLSINKNQKLFFTTISYNDYVLGETKINVAEFLKNEFILVTGIANSKNLVNYLKSKNAKFNHYQFKDHHNYTKNQIDKFVKSNKNILTTEKDYVKLATFKIQRLFSIGIEIKFVEGEKFFIKILNKQLKIN